jgi:NADPH:quinone reductase-like Zn-dependent oxidoreductase
MKAAVITAPGGPEVLRLLDRPDPEPRAGEIRVRARFAGVNFADIAARLGIYPDAPKIPCVIGYEVSGVVEKLGAGVDPSSFSPGDRVLAMTMFGGYAELCCTSAAAARRIPDGMSDEEAAALPVNYLTAYHMLNYLTTVRAGDRVLIHAAAGGVGIAAIQLAKNAGAEIFGTASAAKHEFLKGIGVAHCIDYVKSDFAAEVMRLTRRQGVDIVLDALGGSALAKSYAALRPGGRVFTYGFSRAAPGERRALLTIASEFLRMPKFKPLALMNDNRAVLGVNMNGVARRRPDLLGLELDGLLDLFKKGVIRPRVDKVFPLAEAGAAHRFIQERRNVGKVLLKTNG